MSSRNQIKNDEFRTSYWES